MSVSGMVLVDNNRYLVEILKSTDRVIALFYTSWCPFCEAFLPIFKKYAEKEVRHFVTVKDDEETIAGHYAVEIYPAVLCFDKGKILRRLDGKPGVGLTEEELAAFLAACALP